MILSGVCPTVSKIAASVLKNGGTRFNSKIPGQIIYSYNLNSSAPAVKASKTAVSRFLDFVKKAGADLSSGGGSVSLKNGNVINHIGHGKNLNIFMTKPDGTPIVEMVNKGNISTLKTKGLDLFFDSSSLIRTINK